MQEKKDRKEELTSSLKIRKGTPEDVPQIKKCLSDSWVMHAKHEPELLDEERMRNSDVDTYYQKCFDSPKEHLLLIAESSGRFVGFLKADIQEIPSFFKNPTILYLDDTYVLPEFRRQGIARKLTQQAEEFAREKGIKRIQCRVYSFNKQTQRLLQSMGYRSPHSTWDKVLK